MNLMLDMKNKTAILSVAIFLGAFVIGCNIHGANVRKADRLRQKTEEFKSAKILMAEVKGLRTKIASLAVMGLDSADPDRFLSKVTEIANVSGITVDSVSPGKPLVEDRVTFLPCMIKFSAPYKKVKIFIDKLERDERFISVKNLSLASVKIFGEGTAGGFEEFSQGESENFYSGRLKKNNADGIWVDGQMQAAGFYCQE